MRCFVVLVLVACGGSPPSGDAGGLLDSGRTLDAGRDDSGQDELDAGRDGGIDVDAGPIADSGRDAGFDPLGTITGTCGVLDDELTSIMPFFFDNEMDFDEPWSSADTDRVSEGGAEILSDGTAGGSS